MRRKVLIGALTGLGLTCCAGTIAVADWAMSFEFDHQERIKPERFGAVAKAAHLVLPPGCVWIDGYYFYFQEWMAAVRFLLPPDQLGAFVSGSALPEPKEGLRPAEIMQKGHPATKQDPAWHPEKALKVSGVEDTYQGVQRILMFDLESEGGITVYLIARDAT